MADLWVEELIKRVTPAVRDKREKDKGNIRQNAHQKHKKDIIEDKPELVVRRSDHESCCRREYG